MATQPYCSRPTIQHSAHHTKQPSQWHEGRHRAAQTLLVKVPNIRVHVVTPDTPDRCLTAAQGEDLRARRPITELGPKASVDSQSFLRDCLLAAKTCGELTFHVDGALGRMDSACIFTAITQLHHMLRSAVAAGISHTISKAEEQEALKLLAMLAHQGLHTSSPFSTKHCVAILTSLAWIRRMLSEQSWSNTFGDSSGPHAQQLQQPLSQSSSHYFSAFLDKLCGTLAESATEVAEQDLTRAFWAATQLGHAHQPLTEASCAALLRAAGVATPLLPSGPPVSAPPASPTSADGNLAVAQQEGVGSDHTATFQALPNHLTQPLVSLIWALGQLVSQPSSTIHDANVSAQHSTPQAASTDGAEVEGERGMQLGPYSVALVHTLESTLAPSKRHGSPTSAYTSSPIVSAAAAASLPQPSTPTPPPAPPGTHLQQLLLPSYLPPPPPAPSGTDWLVSLGPTRASTLLHGAAKLTAHTAGPTGRDSSMHQGTGPPQLSPAAVTAVCEAVTAMAGSASTGESHSSSPTSAAGSAERQSAGAGYGQQQSTGAAGHANPASQQRLGLQAISNMAWAVAKLTGSCVSPLSPALTAVPGVPSSPSNTAAAFSLLESATTALTALAGAATAQSDGKQGTGGETSGGGVLRSWQPQEVSNLLGAIAQVHDLSRRHDFRLRPPGPFSQTSTTAAQQRLTTSPQVARLLSAADEYVLHNSHRLSFGDVCEVLFAYAALRGPYTQPVEQPDQDGSSQVAIELHLDPYTLQLEDEVTSSISGSSPPGSQQRSAQHQLRSGESLATPPPTSPAVLAQLASRAEQLAHSAPPSRLVTLLWSLAKLGHVPQRLLAAIEAAVGRAAAESSPVKSSSSSSHSGSDPVGSLEAMQGHLPRPPQGEEPPLLLKHGFDPLEDLSPPQLAKLMWALATWGPGTARRLPVLLQQAELAAVVQVEDMDNQSLSLLLWSFASLGRPCPDLLEAATPVLLSRCGSPQASSSGTPRANSAAGTSNSSGSSRGLRGSRGLAAAASSSHTSLYGNTATHSQAQQPSPLSRQDLAVCAWAVGTLLSARQGSAINSDQDLLWSEPPKEMGDQQQNGGADEVSEQDQQGGAAASSELQGLNKKSGSAEKGESVTSLDAVLKGTSFLRLLRGLAQPIAAQAPQMSAQQLVMCLDAFAAAQVNPGEHVLQTLSTACRARIRGAGSQVLATIAWALAHLQHKDRQALAGIADELVDSHHSTLMHPATATPQAVTTRAPGQSGTSGGDLITAPRQHMLPFKVSQAATGTSPSRPAAADIVALTSTAVSLSKLGIRHPRLLSAALLATCAACDTSACTPWPPSASNTSAVSTHSTSKSVRQSSTQRVPGPREVAPLLWALATAQHPCTQDQLMTLVNALGWQQEGRHNHHHQHAAGESVGKSVGKASGKRVMDPGLVAMALMALPRLGCDPGPSRLAAAAAALQGRAGQLSTHTLCEVVAAFAELQFMPPAPLLDEMMSAVEERVDVTRQELLTLGASLKLGWGLAVLRRTKHPVFKHVATRCMGSRPESFNDKPLMMQKLLELKLMIQAEARMGGFWRAVGRKWRRRVEAGGAEWVPPTLAAQTHSQRGGWSLGTLMTSTVSSSSSTNSYALLSAASTSSSTTTTITTTTTSIPTLSHQPLPAAPAQPLHEGGRPITGTKPSNLATSVRTHPHAPNPLAMLAAVRSALPEVLHGLGYEDARWRVLPQGDEVCMLHVWPPTTSLTPPSLPISLPPSLPSQPSAEPSSAEASSLQIVGEQQWPGGTTAEGGEGVDGEQQPSASTPGPADTRQRDAEHEVAKPRQPMGPLRVAITLVAPWHLSWQLPDAASGVVDTPRHYPGPSTGGMSSPQQGQQQALLQGKNAAAAAYQGRLMLNASASLRDRLLIKQGWVVVSLNVSSWVGLKRSEQVMAVRGLIHDAVSAASRTGVAPIPSRSKPAGKRREARAVGQGRKRKRRHASRSHK